MAASTLASHLTPTVTAPAPGVLGGLEPVGSVVLGQAAETFALLSSATRLHIVWLLSQHACDVNTLAAAVSMSGPAVSQHLGKLRLAGLVSVRRDGRRQVYSVEDPHIAELARAAIEHHLEIGVAPPAVAGAGG